jgi:large subunit ribosomal protein L2
MAPLLPTATVQPLTLALHRGGGRAATGRITAYHRGGGLRRRCRLVDFHRTLADVPALVLSLQVDPNRTARLALLCYANGVLSYILAARGLEAGSPVFTSARFFCALPSFATPLANVPVGSLVHGLSSLAGAPAAFARAAGAQAQVLKKFRDSALLRLRSGEHRLFPSGALVSLGPLGQEQHKLARFSRAGQVRRLGIRPTVRGEAMNPVDHPHGGNTSGGRHPRTPWGRLTKGVRTRSPRKPWGPIYQPRR